MPKGHNCLNCGAQTWHADLASGRTCTACGAIGWTGDEPPTGGGGKGKQCGNCFAQKLHQVVASNTTQLKVLLLYCTGCGSVVAVAPV